jgi:hypothetical protein
MKTSDTRRSRGRPAMNTMALYTNPKTNSAIGA